MPNPGLRLTSPPRRSPSVVLLLLAAFTFALALAVEPVSTNDSGVVPDIASHWIAEWDAGHWSTCWNQFNSEIRGKITLDDWGKRAADTQKRIGKVTGRKLAKVVGPTNAETTVTVQFEASFEYLGACSEKLMLEKQPDGTWSVAGHLIAPNPSAPPPPAAAGAPAYQYSPPIAASIADLAYAEKSPLEKLDLYLPAPSNSPAPVVIWIHGGAFIVGDKRSMPRKDFGPPPKPTSRMGPFQIQVPDVAALTAKGYAVVSLNYRLGTSMDTGALPAVQDGKAAVRFLRANAAKYHLDPDKFAAWGNSAGGYMAAMLGVTGDQPSPFDDPSLGNVGVSSAVQAVVVWYGAEDRLPGADLSIVHYLPTAKSLPAFRIVNGDADQIISPAQARRLNAELTKAGARSTFTLLPGAGHEDPAYMATQMTPTFAFLDQKFGR